MSLATLLCLAGWPLGHLAGCRGSAYQKRATGVGHREGLIFYGKLPTEVAPKRTAQCQSGLANLNACSIYP